MKANATMSGLLVVSVMAFAACQPTSASDQDSACAMRIDTTRSTAEAEIQNAYLVTVKKVVETCASNQSMFEADVVTDNSQAAPTQPVVRSLELEDERGNPTYDRAARHRLVQETIDAVASMMSSSAGQAPDDSGSDILGALRTLAASTAYGEVQLVVLSDGIQASPELRLASKRLNGKDIDEIIRGLDSRSLIPDLDGFKVYMVGVGLGRSSERLSPTKLTQIGAFWRAFFEASGGQLASYGRTLMEFP